MKRALILFFIAASRVWAATDSGGISISPDSGDISPGDVITISFPNPMVTPDRIDMGGQRCPIAARPAIDGTFLWKSETGGELTVGAVVAGATHHFTLAPGLTDAEGHPFSVPDWSADFTAPKFSISTDSEFKQHLSAQPRIALESTYDVGLSDVVSHAWFQDRDSRAHLPLEVIQTTDGPPEAKEFQVTPRDPLPPEHTYDLVIEGLDESKSHQALPYPAVFPMGDTHALKVEWVGAFNAALDTPTIRIKFNDSIPPDTLDPAMIQVTPEVPDLRLDAEGDEIDLTGNFDLTQRYHVTVSALLRGERGYTLPADSSWAATFPPRQPAIAFPGPTLHLRGGRTLRFAFMQSHTPAVTWRLAGIPLEKLAAVTRRLDEYNQTETDPLTGADEVDPATGQPREKQTELLVDAFNLPVTLTGTCAPADSSGDQFRNISVPVPGGVLLSGPYLIEASSRLPDGRIAGGRALVFFGNYLLTQKRSLTEVYLRVAGMDNAQPVAGISIRAVTADNIELGRAVTDEHGLAVFSRAPLFPPKKPAANLFIAETPGGPSVAFADAATYESGAEYAPPSATNHSLIVTDRNLYRPGEEVKIKGILRDEVPGALAVPLGETAHWQVSQGEKVIAEGDAAFSTLGAFEASWKIPRSVALGQCTIGCSLDGKSYSSSTTIDIEEYRVPLFTAVVDATTETGTAAHARVSSAYFHGGANANARVHWKAEWTAAAGTGSNGAMRYNSYPEIGPSLDPSTELSRDIEGDANLDRNGQLTISCDAPFKANAAVSLSNVVWHADITSIDGQTLAGGVNQNFSSSPVILGVSAAEKQDAPRGVTATLEAVDPDNNASAQAVPVTADLYHVVTKTVKEQVAPFVFRYHNNDEFTKVDTRGGMAPGSINFSATDTGRYVVAVNARDVRTPMVAAETTVTGEEPAEMPVENETSFTLVSRTEPWLPGETATLTVQAPYAGVAWVCVETDRILDTMVVPLTGNAADIHIPIKKEYAPNAMVSVYLTRPGGETALPDERFAAASIYVRRPDRELSLAPTLDAAEARPGQTIHGQVRATSEGKPVSGADLAVFAVDDAVLQLGAWTLPDALGVFYPKRPYSISNYQSLTDYVERIDEKSTFQKGFVIGDGGEETTPNITNLRKEFRTLAFWQGSLKTDADGVAAFQFDAPDNLTTYRLVAIGETRASQFGGDASQTVKVTKPLLIDPSLPRFVRDGDEVELRAVVRQSFADSATVSARCITGTGCALTGTTILSGTATRDAPLVLRFRAKIADPDLAPISVRFEAAAASSTNSDAVEISVPVSPPVIVRHESQPGTFNGPAFNASAGMPKEWTRARGNYSLTISTSPWLGAISGIPTILDYPHGCFEQITSKLLCYSLLANLIDYLPGAEARMKDYNTIFQQGIAQIDASLLSDGRLPYWPDETEGNDFVTCQACWALNEAGNAGFDIPDGLTTKLAAAVKAIAAGNGDGDTRAFALFVLASLKTGDDLSATAEDIYLHRENMPFDGRALLAMGLHQLDIMPQEKAQLLREIDKSIAPAAFDPDTFSSMDRTEGICAMAFETIAPENFTADKKAAIHEHLATVLDSASALSTQENLWLLLAFKYSLQPRQIPALQSINPPPSAVSKNGASAAWTNRPLTGALALSGLNSGGLSFLFQAEYTLPELDTAAVDRGFRVERIVRDLTVPTRTGTPGSPYRIGDQLLVTYRLYTKKQQYYVALEDSLPAAFETVNPDIAQIGKFFELPPIDPGDRLLDLSHSEMRDRSTLLYFDDMPPGPGVYSVLVRVTAAGLFRWPATQVVPMYDSRFSGLSASSVCAVSAD